MPPAPPGVSIAANIAAVQGEVMEEIKLRLAIDRFSFGGPEFSSLDVEAIKLAVLIRNFRTGGPMDFKHLTRDGRFADFGNFNFGAVGTALGFSEFTLLFAAGVVQIQTDLGRLIQGQNRIGQGTPFTGPPFGDDPRDQEQIRRGVAFLRSGCVDRTS